MTGLFYSKIFRRKRGYLKLPPLTPAPLPAGEGNYTSPRIELCSIPFSRRARGAALTPNRTLLDSLLPGGEGSFALVHHSTCFSRFPIPGCNSFAASPLTPALSRRARGALHLTIFQPALAGFSYQAAIHLQPTTSPSSPNGHTQKRSAPTAKRVCPPPGPAGAPCAGRRRR